ncbi:PE-PGRS family protein [Mycobacterium tuberculosis RGTB423]|nr:PE-PGRS family protein [Mycobacterium tuberculosis RGTB423]
MGRLPAHTLIGTDSPGAEASWVVGITWWSAVVGGFQMSFVIAVPETIAAAATGSSRSRLDDRWGQRGCGGQHDEPAGRRCR